MNSIDTNFIKAAKLFFLLFIFFVATPAFSQSDTSYTPLVLVDRISDTLQESSGLQWAGNSLWSFNDRGGSPDLYRIDTATNAILQTVRLSGATNVDWEDAAFDGTYFYVGDFGNNLYGARRDLKIYKFPFSAIPDYETNRYATIDSQKIEVINFTYSDQPQNPDSAALNTTKFDCEAMIVDAENIHLFTKDWVDFTSTHYVINSILAGTYVAKLKETLNTGYLVTGADKAPGQKVTVLLGYENSGLGNHFMHILSDYSDSNYFNGNQSKISLPNASYMGQAEGITFRNDNYGYISNERISGIVKQKLFSFNISSFVPTILALELQSFSVSKINGKDKIAWNFNSSIHGLEIQQSSDGLHFNVIKTFNGSTKDFLYNNSANAITYYRLAWKLNNGEYQYSNIVSIKNEENNLICKCVLTATGGLSFILNGNESENLIFKILTTDGKTLSQIIKHSYSPGFNKINFPNRSVLNGVVLLTVYGRHQKTTFPLHVVD